MSNTRTSSNTNPAEFPPEKFMSDPKVSGLNVGLNIAIHTGRAYPIDVVRARIWLINYARIHGVTGHALADTLGMERSQLLLCLSSTHGDIDTFLTKVAALRKHFESTIRPLAPTTGAKLVRKVVAFALEQKTPCDVLGKWRSGKSHPAWECFLRNMDRAVWFLCPSGNDDRTFVAFLARAFSIGTGTSMKPGQLRPKIFACLGARGVDLVITDEAQRLWPTAAPGRTVRLPYPRRLEFMRDMYDTYIPSQVGLVNLTTPQHAEMMHESITNHALWAPGQWEGRAQSFVLPETMTPAEIASIARWHGPELTDDAVEALTKMAASSEGYIGKMVKCIERARFFHSNGKTITRADVLGAARSMEEANLNLRGKIQ